MLGRSDLSKADLDYRMKRKKKNKNPNKPQKPLKFDHAVWIILSFKLNSKRKLCFPLMIEC